MTIKSTFYLLSILVLLLQTGVSATKDIGTTSSSNSTGSQTQTTASAQAEKVQSNYLFGTVGEIKQSLYDNAMSLIASCNKEQTATFDSFFELAVNLGKIRSLVMNGKPIESEVSKMKTKVQQMEHIEPEIKAIDLSSFLIGDSAKKLSVIESLVPKIESILVSKESHSLVPIAIYAGVIISNAVEYGTIANFGLEDDMPLPITYKFLENTSDLTSTIGDLDTVEKVKAQCSASEPVYGSWSIKPDLITKDGVAFYTWLKQDSLSLTQDKNVVVTLESNDQANTYLASISINKNTSRQTELVYNLNGTDIISVVSKCLDYTFVLVTIEEDCEDLLVRIVIRNITNDFREVITKKVSGISLRSLVARVKSIYPNDQSLSFTKLDYFKYSETEENNVFAVTLDQGRRGLIHAAASSCQVPDNCAYFNGEACEKCEDSKFMQDQECVNKCDDGYYEDGDTCKPCNVNCEKCTGPAATQCSECEIAFDDEGNFSGKFLSRTISENVDGSSISVGSCVPLCPIGTYQNIIYDQEQPPKATKSICSSCSDVHSKCVECSDKQTCTKCKNVLTDENPKSILHDGTCVQTCADIFKENGTGYYWDQVKNTCETCTNKCETCSPSGICTTCIAGMVLQGDICIGTCNEGYFPNNGVCEKCLLNCDKCSSKNKCEICSSDYHLAEGMDQEDDTCAGECSEGYKEVKVTINEGSITKEASECHECPENCKNCDKNINECLECNNPIQKEGENNKLFFLNPDHTCKDSCPEGYFKDENTKTCEKCGANCKECTSFESCTICEANFPRFNGECLTKCPPGHIEKIEEPANQEDSPEKICEICPFNENCDQCSKEVNESCETCDSGYPFKINVSGNEGNPIYQCTNNCGESHYVLENICKPCSNANCSVCHEDKCTVCKEGFKFKESKCVPECGEGYVEVANERSDGSLIVPNVSKSHKVCMKCSNGCSKCKTDGTCEQCISTMSMIRYTSTVATVQTTESIPASISCISICPERTLKVKTSETPELYECHNCSKDCLKCNQTGQCETCEEGFFLNTVDGTCTQQCPSNTAKIESNQKKCIPCPQNCSTCRKKDDSSHSEEIECTDCEQNFALFEGNCQNDCPKLGYFKNSNSHCIGCPSECKTCTSSTVCTSCKDKLILSKTTDQGEVSCISSCGSNHTKITGICLAGQTGSECTTEKCVSCGVEDEVVSNSYSCLTCTENKPENCITCPEGKYLQPLTFKADGSQENRACKDECPKGFYKDDATKECKNCSENCGDCLSESMCIECNVNSYKRMNNNTGEIKCVTSCEDGKTVEGEFCKDCETINCEDCIGDATKCNKCRKNEENINVILHQENKCVTDCPAGFTRKSVGTNTKIEMCVECQSENCSDCSGSIDKCLLCEEGYFLYIPKGDNSKEGTCKKECPEGSTVEGYKCVHCEVDSCGKCDTGKGDCQQCILPNKLLLSSPKECVDCELPGFIARRDICDKCAIDGCDHCEDIAIGGTTKHEEVCHKCSGTKKLQIQEDETYKCVEDCKEGFTSDAAGENCVPCEIESCAVCNLGKTCTECKEQFFLAFTKGSDETEIPVCHKDKCPDGTFHSAENNKICIDCPYNCETCKSFEDCDSCRDKFYLKHDKCLNDCGDGFRERNDGECEKCLIVDNISIPSNLEVKTGCKNCQADVSKCEECYGVNVQDKNGVFQGCDETCSDGYFSFGEPTKCRPCSTNCKSCNDLSQCNICVDGYFVQTDGSCEPDCNPGEFKSDGKCIKCHTKDCLSCPEDNCEECHENLYLAENEQSQKTCSVDCLPGFYKAHDKEGKNICAECNAEEYNCAACSGPHTCTKCNDNEYLLNDQGVTKCVSKCPGGFKETNIGTGEPVCEKCQVLNCENCSLSIDECKACFNPFALSSDKKNCFEPCPDGERTEYSAEDKIYECVKCSNKGCKTCNADKCTQCDTPGYFINQNGDCIEDCNDGYVSNETPKTCMPCQIENCKDCNSDINTCNGCGEEMFLQPLENLGEILPAECRPNGCIDGFFSANLWNGDGSKSTKTCVPCPSTCKKCELKQPEINEFLLTHQFTSEEIKCTECKETFFLKADSTCTNDCGDGYFENDKVGTSEDKCVKCLKDCKECENTTTCHACEKGNLLKTESQPDQCVTTCPEGTAPVNGVCTKCTDANCAVCSNHPGECNICNNETFKNSDRRCVTECGDEFFENTENRKCEACTDSNCLHCPETTDICTRCENDFVLVSHNDQLSCQQNCPLGYKKTLIQVGDQDTKFTCVKCLVDNCDNCNTKVDSCDVCNENHQFIFTNIDNENTQCLGQCPDGYYEDNESKRCLSCNIDDCKDCKEVNNGIICEKCNPSFYLIGNTCNDSCDPGWKKSKDSNGVDICEECQVKDCKKCDLSVDECESCNKESEAITHAGSLFVLINQENNISHYSCTTECGAGMRKNIQTGICESCSDSKCNKCETDKDSCEQCDSNSIFMFITGKCEPEDNCTSEGTAPMFSITVNNRNECHPCKSDCGNCSSSNSCDGCVSPKLLSNGNCVDNCDIGFFAHDHKCKKCEPENCATCSSSEVCTYCGLDAENNKKYLKKSDINQDKVTCVSDCDSGYYVEETEFTFTPHGSSTEETRIVSTCRPCPEGCATCSSPELCETCSSPGLFLKKIIESDIAKKICTPDCGEGFAPDSEGRCESCSLLLPNVESSHKCSNCDISEKETETDRKCKECMIGTYLKEGECVANCGKGWRIGDVSNVCEECSEGCDDCHENKSICTACSENWYLMNHKCHNPCPNFTFNNVSTKTCQKCSVEGNCLKCSSEDKCSQCINTYTNQEEEGNSEENLTALPLVTMSADFPGASPSEIGKVKCINECPEGYFYDIKSQAGYPTCTQCNEKFSHCSVCNSTTCTECGKGYKLIEGECIIDCQEGHRVTKANACEECPAGTRLKDMNTCEDCSAQGCKQCDADKNKCEVCENDHFKFIHPLTQEITCVKNCSTIPPVTLDTNVSHGFMEKGTECVECSTNCGKCSIFNVVDSSCDQCIGNTYISEAKEGEKKTCSTCESTAKVSYNGHLVSVVKTIVNEVNTCSACKPNNCNKCAENSDNKCSECKLGFFLNSNGECVSNCPEKFYNDVMVNPHKCSECNPACSSCTSKNVCTDCAADFFLNNKKECVTNCGERLFGNAERKCQSCSDGSCLSCPNDKCDKCDDTHALYNKICHQNCPSETYMAIRTQADLENSVETIKTGKTCIDCNTNCKECNSTGCTHCAEGFLLKGSECVSDCGTGFYAIIGAVDVNGIQSPSTCEPCPFPNCPKCDARHCSGCNENEYLLNKAKCTPECPDGYFKNNETFTCDLCSSECETCTSIDVCSKCKNSFFLKDTKCVENCGNKLFGDIISKKCVNCPTPDCEKCSGKEGKKCYGCTAGKKLQDGVCVEKCSDDHFTDEFNNICEPCEPHCGRCTKDSDHKETCLSCLGGFQNIDGNCVNPCPDTYTKIDGICQACYDRSCDVCSHTHKCSKCSDSSGKFLFEGLCLENCPEGTYQDETSTGRKCLPCDEGCDSCSKTTEGIVVCDRCENGYFSFIENGQQICGESCPSGTFPSCATQKCEDCHESCSNCYTGEASECIECAEGYFRDIKSCVKPIDCGIGKYAGSKGRCEFCEVDSCDTCSDATTCTHCQDGYKLQADGSCKLLNTYYSLIRYPLVSKPVDNSPYPSISIFNKMPGLANAYLLLSMSFWVRRIDSNVTDYEFYPIFTIDNRSSKDSVDNSKNISFGVKRNSDKDDVCQLRIGHQIAEIENCGLQNLLEYNFFAISLKHVNSEIRVEIRRGVLGKELSQVLESTVSFPAENELVGVNSNIDFNSKGDILGNIEIAKFRMHDYYIGNNSVTGLFNDIPDKLDYYCKSVSDGECSACSNGEKEVDSWRCPAGGFDLIGNLEIRSSTETTYWLHNDATHSFTSDRYQLDFWFYCLSENCVYIVDSSTASTSTFTVEIGHNAVKLDGTNIMKDNSKLPINTWFHFAIKYQAENIELIASNIKGEKMVEITKTKETYRRICNNSKIDFSETDSEVRSFHFLINNTTSYLNMPHLPKNCADADENWECTKCDDGYKLNSAQKCVEKEIEIPYNDIPINQFAVFDKDGLESSFTYKKDVSFSFWVKPLIASIYTQESKRYSIMSYTVEETINSIIDVTHTYVEGAEYGFVSEITVGKSKFTWNRSKLENNYNHWLRFVVAFVGEEEANVYGIYKEHMILNEKITLAGMTKITFGDKQSQEVNLHYARIRYYHGIIGESNIFQEKEPIACDSMASECDFDTGNAITCANSDATEPDNGQCKTFVFGFKVASNFSSDSKREYQEESRLSLETVVAASEQYGVMGNLMLYDLENLPEGRYLMANLTDNWSTRVTQNTTTKHLIALQLEINKEGQQIWSWLVNSCMEIVKITIKTDLEIKNNTLLTFYAGINADTKEFKYKIENKNKVLSEDDTVKLSCYSEKLVSTATLRVFYPDSNNGVVPTGFFYNLYVLVNRFQVDSVEASLEASSKIASVNCGPECLSCYPGDHDESICAKCSDKADFIGGKCLLPADLSGRLLITHGLLEYSGDIENNSISVSSENVSKIMQFAFYFRKNYFTSDSFEFLKIGGITFELTSLPSNQLVIRFEGENEPSLIQLSSAFEFNLIRVIFGLETTKIRLEMANGDSKEINTSKVKNTLFSTQMNSIKLTTSDDQVQIYGLHALKHSTGKPEIGFQNLDCKADFAGCAYIESSAKTYVIAGSLPAFYGINSDNQEVSYITRIPIFISQVYMKANNSTSRVGWIKDFISSDNMVRSQSFTASFQITLTGNANTDLPIFALGNSQENLELNTKLVNLTFNADKRKFLAESNTEDAIRSGIPNQVELNLTSSTTAFFVRIAATEGVIRVVVQTAGQEYTATLKADDIVVTPYTWFKLLGNTTSEDVSLRLDNFVLDYSGELDYVYSKEQVSRNALVDGCGNGNVREGDLCLPVSGKHLSAFTHMVPYHASVISESNDAIKFTADLTSDDKKNFYISSWIKLDNYEVAEKSSLLKLASGDHSLIDLRYKDTHFYFEIAGSEVFSLYGTENRHLMHWYHFYISVAVGEATNGYAPHDIKILVYSQDYRLAGTYDKQQTLKVTSWNDMPIIYLANKEAGLPVNFYNLAVGFGPFSNPNTPQPPHELSKSCLTETVNGLCNNRVTVDLVNKNGFSDEYIFNPLGSLFGVTSGSIYAPNFSITLVGSKITADKLKEVRGNSNKEIPIFLIPGGTNMMSLFEIMNVSEVDYNKAELVFLLGEDNKIVVKTTRGYSTTDFNIDIDVTTVEEYQIQVMFDAVQDKCVIVAKTDNLTVTNEWQHVHFDALTSSTLVYKDKSIGSVEIDVNGIDRQPMQEPKGGNGTLCKVQDEHASKCYKMASKTTTITVECEEGYVPVTGRCSVASDL